jgi:hypothetical protein
MHIPDLMRRRRAAFKAEVVAAVRDAILTDLASRIPISTQQDVTPFPVSTENIAAETTLQKLLVDGRVLQARLSEGERTSLVSHELAVEIARWEAVTLNSLMGKDRPSADDFRNLRTSDDMTIDPMYKTYNRINGELEILEIAIRDGS